MESSGGEERRECSRSYGGAGPMRSIDRETRIGDADAAQVLAAGDRTPRPKARARLARDTTCAPRARSLRTNAGPMPAARMLLRAGARHSPPRRRRPPARTSCLGPAWPRPWPARSPTADRRLRTSTNAVPVAHHVEPERRRVRQIDQAIGDEGTAIVDAHHDTSAVRQVRHLHVARQRQGRVRRGHGVHVVDIAVAVRPPWKSLPIPGGDAALLIARARC